MMKFAMMLEEILQAEEAIQKAEAAAKTRQTEQMKQSLAEECRLQEQKRLKIQPVQSLVTPPVAATTRATPAIAENSGVKPPDVTVQKATHPFGRGCG